VNESRAQRRDPEARQAHPGDAPPAIPMPEPRHTLQGRDHTARRTEPGHRREYAGLFALFASLLLAGGAAGLAHAADSPTAPHELTIAMAVLLGIVQGITEFLPISSDGHLALGQAVLGLPGGAGGHRFTIVVHAGTLLAVVWTYRADLVSLAGTAWRPSNDSPERRLLLAMLVASLPLGLAVLPGVEDGIIAMESQIRWVGFWLWVSALALWIGFRRERLHPPAHPGAFPTLRQAIIIGFAQVTAILPGLSRSGMTIASALVVGLDRAMAARFSFLISVIAVGGAVAKELLGLAMGPPDGGGGDPLPLAVGFATSLVVGLFALRGLLVLVGRGRVMGFVVYLAIVGAVAIVVG
jgi:undecaprenyl-diphosphatase